MATVYFTNNADSGDGSLRAAVALAASGDVVTPDPDVFGDAAEIVISLSSLISKNAPFTLDAGPYALVLDGQGACRCLGVSYPVAQTFVGVTFYRGYAANNGGGCVFCNAKADLTFKRCVFAGGYNSGASGGNVFLNKSGRTLLEDCVVTCGRAITATTGGGIRIGADVDSATIRRCTIVGNAGTSDVCVASGANVVVEDSLVGYANAEGMATTVPSQIGFVAPPPDELAPADWTADLWREWNLRLNFDSPYRSGAAYVEGSLDVTGRARKSDGAIGAYGEIWLVVRAGETAALTQNAFVERMELEDGATLAFSGQDLVASASESASIGAATLRSDSRAYVSYPASTDDSAAVCTNVVRRKLGAGLTAFSAAAVSPTDAQLTWTASDPTAGVLLERRVGDAWETVDENAVGGSLSTSIPSGRTTFRAFDGAAFFTDDAWTCAGAQFSVLATWASADRPNQNWEAIAQMATTTEKVMPGQGITILARIYDAFDVDSALLNTGSNIDSVKYTCYAANNGLFEESLAPVEGHEDVDVGTSCVLEALQTSDAWTLDEKGYNFVLTPDVRTYPLFAAEGEYSIKTTITPVDGNPIVFYTAVSVVAE